MTIERSPTRSLTAALKRGRKTSVPAMTCNEEITVMPTKFLRSIVTGRPGWVVVFWFAAAGALALVAPNLTKLATEGQANLLGRDAESLGASEALRSAWPDQAYESLLVAAVHRSSGLSGGRPGLQGASGRADRPERSAENGATRAWAGLTTGGCPAAAQQGRDGRSCGRASVQLVRSPGDTRGGRLAPVTQARAARLDLPEGGAGAAAGRGMPSSDATT